MNFLERALDGKNQLWRYVVTILGAFLVMNFIGGIPMFAVMVVQIIKTGGELSAAQSLTDFSFLGVSQNVGFFLMMFIFAVGLFATILFIKLLHQRSFAETVNGTRKVRWSRSFFGFGVWLAIMIVYMAIEYSLSPELYTFQLEVSTFIPLFFLTIIFIPLQATYEELTFRGYLAQGIAGWTKNRWLAIIIPGLLFGLMHSANPEVGAFGFWEVMPQYVIFGLIWGLISVLDDGIELAIGAHTANNILGCLIVTHEASALQVPSMFLADVEDANMLVETGGLLVMGIILIFICAKKYKWDSSILRRKVE